MRRITAVIALFLGLGLAAQDRTAVPLPTRLRVAVKGAEVTLTWDAPSDAPGGWGIYRSPLAIAADSLAKAVRLTIASPNIRTLTAIAPDGAPYFYAVLPLDRSGSPSLSFLPGQTVTRQAVVATGAPAVTVPKITALKINTIKDIAKLSFTIAAGTGPVLVYRSIGVFKTPASLLEANLISTLPDTTRDFTDFPIPGISYYYALIPESNLKAGRISFVDGLNTLSSPIFLASTKTMAPLPETGTLARITPLPFHVFASNETIPQRDSPAALLPETEKAIAGILSPYVDPTPRAPALVILAPDRGQAAGGEAYALSLILQGAFAKGDWKASVSQLSSYLSLNRSPAVASRAHFYLAQSLAMTGSSRDAFFEFLKARDFNAPETRQWILYLIKVLRDS
ncbi:MAG: hypothetical protein ACOYM2_13745 [Rectinemataceae bacterium]